MLLPGKDPTLCVKLMRSQVQLERYFGARVAWHSDSAQIVTSLMALLEDASTQVRSAAARSLGKLGEEQARQRLREIAQDASEAPDTRYRAIGALSELGDSTVLSLVEPELQSDQVDARKWGARCLANVGGPEAENRLRSMLNGAPFVERIRLKWLLRRATEKRPR